MARKTSGTSLSNISDAGRKTIKYGIILLIVFIVGRFTWTTVSTIYRRLNPPPPSPPTMGFGRLPLPAFPAQLPQDRPQNYTLETVGQKLPAYGIKAQVFFMPSAQPNLLALDRAKEHAASLQFVFEPEKVSNSNYRWRRTQPLPATLEMNIVYNQYEMRADWASSINLLEKKLIPNQQQATSEVRTILRSLDLFQPDIATAEPKLTYLTALAGETRPAASVSEADFTQIDIYRQVGNGYPSVTSQYSKGVIRILLSGSRAQGERILAFQSDYVPVSWTDYETYPLRTAQEALADLQAGKGYVTNKGAKEPAVIRKVYLAYYEPPTPQNYYQPVYVFEGDEGFQAFVTALSNNVYQTVQE